MGEARRRMFGIFGGKKRVQKVGVLLALPTLEGYSRVDQVLRAHMAGVYTATPDFKYLIEPYSLIGRYPVSDARNDCSQHFMENTDHEWLVFVDHDMGMPENWLDLLGKYDIVSALTLMWAPARKPLQRLQFNQMRLDQDGQSETLFPTLKNQDPYEVDVVGTACMAIHRRVFDKLGPRPFKEPVGVDGRRAMGEDVAFCREARSVGFRVTVVPSVVFNHYKEVGLYEVYETMIAMLEFGKKLGRQQAQAETEALRVRVDRTNPSYPEASARGGVA